MPKQFQSIASDVVLGEGATVHEFVNLYGVSHFAPLQRPEQFNRAMLAFLGKVLVNRKRPRYPMPDDITTALELRGLTKAYKDRPAYQQNDYIGWISRAKGQETCKKRLEQMLDELEKGGVYMNMQHTPSAR